MKVQTHRHMYIEAGVMWACVALKEGTICSPEPHYICCVQPKRRQVLLIGDLQMGAVSVCRYPGGRSCG